MELVGVREDSAERSPAIDSADAGRPPPQSYTMKSNIQHSAYLMRTLASAKDHFLHSCAIACRCHCQVTARSSAQGASVCPGHADGPCHFSCYVLHNRRYATARLREFLPCSCGWTMPLLAQSHGTVSVTARSCECLPWSCG